MASFRTTGCVDFSSGAMVVVVLHAGRLAISVASWGGCEGWKPNQSHEPTRVGKPPLAAQLER